ncbi:MAG TPA: class I SAM-dependent methyltransferase [Candidatus Saccharimonadales bacterium]|nr:class I SAM-dependent methyltransferase [Candidatus Saccharimonadales bacterium]
MSNIFKLANIRGINNIVNMRKKIKNSFDGIAESYYDFVPSLSPKYIKFLQKTFDIKSEDKIIDLGCGSGDLALELSKYSTFVEGIDISKDMIKMAEEKDTHNKVKWINKSVDRFDLGKNKYDIIISFESFHLFPNQVKLIKRCAKSLKAGGILCIGWRMFAFDMPLQHALEETFAEYNVPYEFGYWTCPNFPEICLQAKTDLSTLRKKTMNVKTRVANEVIMKYIFNLSNSAHLREDLKKKLSQSLWKKMLKIFPSGECIGYDQYTIMYCHT